jgi:hypothetical protein
MRFLPRFFLELTLLLCALQDVFAFSRHSYAFQSIVHNSGAKMKRVGMTKLTLKAQNDDRMATYVADKGVRE